MDLGVIMSKNKEYKLSVSSNEYVADISLLSLYGDSIRGFDQKK